ncbi:MAG: CvpA family protein [Thermomicrobiaceae bacterium]
MNLLDILIILALVAVFIGIFFAGLWRALSALVSLWIGLTAADIFGNPIGGILQGLIPDIEPWTSNLIGFILAFFIAGATVMYLSLRSFRTLTERSGYRFDIRGGMPVLILTILLACVVSLATVTVIVELAAETLDDIPTNEAPDFASRQYREASLRPATERMSEYVYNATGSWVPGGAPSVLAPED